MVDSFPNRSSLLDLDGLAYAYVDQAPAAGAARPGAAPVVLVHGNPTWSFAFRSLLAALPAAGYRAVAPDHVGMGRSAKPSPSDYPYTLARRVADLGRFLDAVVPGQPVTLVLHDWGGPIGMGWAVEHPERVAGLVLLNTAAFPLPPGKRVPAALRLARSRPVGELAVLRANAFVRATGLLGTRRRLPAEVRRGYAVPYDRPASRVGVLQFVRDVPTGPGDPAYPVLRRTSERLGLLADRPVLVCWGMADFVFDGRILAEWERIYPHAEVHRFDRAGHLVLEDAAEEIGSLVLGFLDRLPARPS